MSRQLRLLISCLSLLCLGQLASARRAPCFFRKNFNFAAAPADNPLRGLVPYDTASARDAFPHSIELSYFSLRELMADVGQFDWSPIDGKLALAQGRGVQLNFRVWVEYPNAGDHLPDFLRDTVNVTRWEETDSAGTVTTVNYSPDYEAQAMRDALTSFIAALGQRYDAHPAVGFVTAGLLGKWGAWHNYPADHLMATKQVQSEVMRAYTQAFPTKKILLRYPAGPSDTTITENANEPFGYHDDSFGWSTLYEGASTPSWYFGAQMEAAGATNKWQTVPIGGEIYPDQFSTVFTPSYTGQDFVQCVEQTHVSWLRDSGMFSADIHVDAARVSAATEAVNRMGYALHVMNAVKYTSPSGTVLLRLGLENRGVAPFYYDWPVHLRASTESEAHIPADWRLSQILPGQAAQWLFRLSDALVYTITVPNPMAGGRALRFSNEEQVGDELRIEFD